MQTYLGIDAGGSGSRWVLVDGAGNGLADGGDGPPIQVSELGVGDSAARLLEVLQQAGCRDARAAAAPAVAGLAGVGMPGTRRELADRMAASGASMRVVEDSVTGAAAAFADGPGIAVFAGTGSFAVALDARGVLHRTGGRGNVASDHGGGYWIVRAAVEAVLLAVDGVGPETSLASRVPAALGADPVEAVGLAIKELPVVEVARAYPCVVRSAVDGDVVAAQVLDAGADGLTRLAGAAAARAGLDPATTVVTIGGGTTRARAYFERIAWRLGTAGFGSAIRRLPRPPEHGAAVLARAADQRLEPFCCWVDG